MDQKQLTLRELAGRVGIPLDIARKIRDQVPGFATGRLADTATAPEFYSAPYSHKAALCFAVAQLAIPIPHIRAIRTALDSAKFPVGGGDHAKAIKRVEAGEECFACIQHESGEGGFWHVSFFQGEPDIGLSGPALSTIVICLNTIWHGLA